MQAIWRGGSGAIPTLPNVGEKWVYAAILLQHASKPRIKPDWIRVWLELANTILLDNFS